MKEPKGTPVVTYIYLAIASLFVGVVLLFAVLVITQNIGIDITTNLWWLALPVVLAMIINIILIEMWERYKR